MKAFLAAVIVVAAIGLISDFVFGGAVTKSGVFGEKITEASGTMLIDTSAAAAHVSPNVRLPGQDE
jgi:hypothetical protein